MTSLVRCLHASHQVCFLYDSVTSIPPHVGEMVDAVATFPSPDDALMRAMALQVPGGRGASLTDLWAIRFVPWPLLSLLLRGGRSVRASIVLAQRIGAANDIEKAAEKEKSSVGKDIRAPGISPGPTLENRTASAMRPTGARNWPSISPTTGPAASLGRTSIAAHYFGRARDG